MSTVLFDPVKTQAKVTDTVIVGFSGGKDSIVTLDLCMRYFKNVYVFYMYLVPGLSFQEKTLDWYENKYDTEIIRLPHFELSNMFRYGTFRDLDFSVPIVGINDVYAYMRQKTDAWWISAGERAADSIIRNAMIKNSSSIDVLRGRFYPLAYWKKNDVLRYIKYHKLYLPPDSRKLGFSFKSLEGRELQMLEKHYPEDLERVKRVFPYCGAAIERWKRYHGE